MVAMAGVCLIVGVAIGFSIPRGGPAALPGPSKSDRLAPVSPQTAGRDIFSPEIRNDAHVRREQLKVVEMLEQQCRTTRKDCALATAARQAFERR
jgi:hypothetical protein